jgi:fructose-specific phosphotransferase system IIA component
MKPDTIASLFEERFCIFSLRSRKKLSVLQEMVKHLKAEGRITDEQFILEMLKNRESLGSTGLGNGVAFPHGRSIAINGLTVLFARSSAGVDFESLDGKPTHLFFLILAPSEKGADIYLALLSELINLVQQPDKLRELTDVRDFVSLMKIIKGGGS